MKHLSDSRLPFLFGGLSFLLLIVSNFAHRVKFDFTFAIGSAIFYGVLVALYYSKKNKWLRLALLIIGVFFAFVVGLGSLFICYGACPEGVNVTFVNSILYLSIYSYLVSATLLTFKNTKIRAVVLSSLTAILLFSLVVLRF